MERIPRVTMRRSPFRPIQQVPRAPPKGDRLIRGDYIIPLSLICNSCHHLMPQGTKMPFKRYPLLHRSMKFNPSLYKMYLNCTSCSSQIVIRPNQRVYEIVSGATQPINKETGVCDEVQVDPQIKTLRPVKFRVTPGSTDTPDGHCESSMVGGNPIPASGDDAIVNDCSSQQQRRPN